MCQVSKISEQAVSKSMTRGIECSRDQHLVVLIRASRIVQRNIRPATKKGEIHVGSRKCRPGFM